MDTVKAYRHAVWKALHCGFPLKKKLLRQLDDILSPFLEENATPMQDELCQALGEPRQVAETMLHEQPNEVLDCDRRNRIIRWVAAIVLLSTLVSFAVYYVIPREINLTVNEAIVVEEEVIKDE